MENLTDRIQKGLKTKLLGRKIYHYPEVVSTNDIAKKLIRGEAIEGGAMHHIVHGTVILAEIQTKGKGRLGRDWASPRGGIWLSCILSAPKPQSASLLTLLTSVAVARAIQALTSLPVKIKWPNDLLVHGKKVAGILSEKVAEYVIVGIGVNLNVSPQALPENLRSLATSLKAESGEDIPQVKFIQILLKELEKIYLRLKEGEASIVLQEWKSLNTTLGSWVKVRSFTEVWEGQAVNVDREGYLLVRLADGTLKRVASGDVTLRSEV